MAARIPGGFLLLEQGPANKGRPDHAAHSATTAAAGLVFFMITQQTQLHLNEKPATADYADVRRLLKKIAFLVARAG